MKKLLSIFMMLALSFNAFAQQTETSEKIVTNKWSLLAGSATITDHYFNNQEYNGANMGLSVEFGSFYKKNQNLSWKLDMTYVGIGSALKNPAHTSTINIYDAEIEYATSYNWNPAKNLLLRAGGSFCLSAGATIAPDGVNNMIQPLLQPQFKAVVGVRYGWNLKKMNLHLFADLGLPFMGITTVATKYEGAAYILNNTLPWGLLKPEKNHIQFTSFHNLQGFKLDAGMDMEFKNFTFSMSIETNNKWWHAYDWYTHRKFIFFNMGFSVDLVSRSRMSTNNRYF